MTKRLPTVRALAPRSLLTIAAAVVTASSAPAQAPVKLRGEVYDSLHNKPLDGATVSILGAGKTKVADARGRFEFDSIAPGSYTVVAYHALLDTIGLGGLSAHVTVGTVSGETRLAIPSFASFWRLACGGEAAPKDSGFVYGTIRDATTQKTVAGALVEVSWVDMTVDSLRRIHEKRWRRTTRSDATGNYGVCGVPTQVLPAVQASSSEGSSGSIDLFGEERRVRRRDLVVGPLSETDSTRRGAIAGILTDPTGTPFVGARVLVEAMPETRSGADGKFVIRNVPTGTRQVEIRSVGMAPYITTVDVAPHDTATIAAQLKKVTLLDVVRVTGSARQKRLLSDLEQRKRMGLGFVQDSTAFAGRVEMVSAFMAFPSLAIQRVGNSQRYLLTLPATIGRCVANLWIDGIQQNIRGDPTIAYDQLLDFSPDQIAAIEVYPRGASVPMQFSSIWSSCGAVVIWTKWALGR